MFAVRLSTRAVAIGLSLLTMAAVLIAVPTTVSAADAPPSGVSLEGYWQFIMDDDPSYADPSYDDSGWDQRLAPEAGGQFDLDTVNATVWFRQSFSLPGSAAGEQMWASMGVMDDADEVYINGTLVGASGTFPPAASSAFFHHRLYEIPDGLLTFGADSTNVIAARVRDSGGGGGITRGPLGIFTRDEVRRELWGVDMTPVGKGDRNDVIDVIEAQASALKAGDIDGYAATLDAGFFHAGHDSNRQVARMDRVTSLHPGIDRVDEILEVGVTSDGLFVAEVHRTWSDGGVAVAEEPGIAHAPQTGPDVSIEFLYFDPDTLLEVGNYARFYRDFVNSEVSDARREFNVYLPPSYFTDTERRYPTVYHLHGAGGNNRPWEGVDLDQRVERLINEDFIDEMIVVMPSGRSADNRDTWYANSSVEQWRTMFLTELLPQVDATYRTIDDRTARGISGWSMGGQGAFTTAWAAQDTFGSIASLSGALSFPPLAGNATDLAVNAAEAPNVQVNYRDPVFLRSYCYWLYAGEEDDFAFDEATRAMMAELAAKTVIVEAEIRPNGQHNGHTEIPGLVPAFRLHSLAFDAHDDLLGCQATVPVNSDPDAADDDVSGLVGQAHNVAVLDNDSDVDHDELRLTDVTDPEFGTARIEYGGTISYVPDAGFVGTDTFDYTVTDGREGYATATVTVTVTEQPDVESASDGRVHGSGHWDDEVGYKVSFSFDAKVDEKKGLKGKLKVKDKDADVKIDAKDITWLGTGEGMSCNGVVLDGVNTFAFTATGEFEIGALEVEDAEFFACGIDNGKGKAKYGELADVFFVEVTSGGVYSTTEGDDYIDGGNVHLHDPIVAGEFGDSDGAAASSAVAGDGGVMVVDLDPMFTSEVPALSQLTVTAVAHRADDTAGGDTVTLTWVTADGTTGEATAVTDTLGVAVFSVPVPIGETEVTAWVDGVDSNPVWLSGT